MPRKPVCLECEVSMDLTCVGAYCLEMDNLERPYLLWACDLYTCRICGHQVAASFANVPTARCGDDDFDALIKLGDRKNKLVRQYPLEKREGEPVEPVAEEMELQVLVFYCDSSQDDVLAYRTRDQAEDAYWQYWGDNHNIDRGDEIAVEAIVSNGRNYVAWTVGIIKKEGGAA